MQVTKLNNPELFITKLEYYLKPYGIELHQVEYRTRSSVNFRASRVFNKPYTGGGVKFGAAIAVNGFGQLLSNIVTPKFKQSKVLHWEEWAVINYLINHICDEFQLQGQCKSYFDFKTQYIRKNGIQTWTSPLAYTDYTNLREIARNHLVTE